MTDLLSGLARLAIPILALPLELCSGEEAVLVLKGFLSPLLVEGHEESHEVRPLNDPHLSIKPLGNDLNSLKCRLPSVPLPKDRALGLNCFWLHRQHAIGVPRHLKENRIGSSGLSSIRPEPIPENLRQHNLGP